MALHLEDYGPRQGLNKFLILLHKSGCSTMIVAGIGVCCSDIQGVLQ